MKPTRPASPQWRRRFEWGLLVAFPLIVLGAMALPNSATSSLSVFFLLVTLGTLAGLWSNVLYVSAWAAAALVTLPVFGIILARAFC